MPNSDQIIKESLHYHSNDLRKEQEEALKKYGDVLEFINLHHEFTLADMAYFQKLGNRTILKNRIISLVVTGRQIMCTSFKLVMLVTLFLCGNLYKYSQQGFEAIMSKVKEIYQYYTSKGQHGAEVQSYILQIWHFLIQMMLWNSINGDSCFKKK